MVSCNMNSERKEKDSSRCYLCSTAQRRNASQQSSSLYVSELNTQTHPLQSHQMFNLVHVELDVRVHLQVLVVSRVDFVFDVLLQVGHLIV